MRYRISSCFFKNIPYGHHVLRLNSRFTAQLPVEKRCFFSSWAKVWSGLSLGMIRFTFPESTEAALFAVSAISSAARSLPEQRKDETLSYSETLTYSSFDHSFCQSCSPLSCLSPAALSQKPLQQKVRILVLEVISSMLSVFHTLCS